MVLVGLSSGIHVSVISLYYYKLVRYIAVCVNWLQIQF